jgi:hypothetical protein
MTTPEAAYQDAVRRGSLIDQDRGDCALALDRQSDKVIRDRLLFLVP